MAEVPYRPYTRQRKPRCCPKCGKRTLAAILYKDLVRDYFSLHEREQLLTGACVIGGRRRVTGTHAREEGYAKWMCRNCGCEVYAEKHISGAVRMAG
ncbi:MAG: hypothetical protein CMM07_05890 [Rhodopirellula sp.]|nr:hypothetical protein [Rhodopirellula sp.]